MSETLSDHILLLLAIKAPKAEIDLDHIYEKVSRDLSRGLKKTVRKEEVAGELTSLEAKGLVESMGGLYYITGAGRSEIKSRLQQVASRLNLSYRMVLAAKDYYPRVADRILPFLRGRPISVVKVFSDESDPAGKVKPLFVRYTRYKPSPQHIRIESGDQLMGYVDDHAVDFIPYVHGFSRKEPSWLVIDLDAGEGLKGVPEGFLAVKFVAEKVFMLLEGSGVKPAVKFSGSRGMQVWAALDNSKLPSGDPFAHYRRIIQLVQARVEEEIAREGVPGELRGLVSGSGGSAGMGAGNKGGDVGLGGEIGGLTTAKVAGKAERARKVLLDWSSMKPMGDVRAPFSIHYKTGLVSCPVDPSRIMEFDPSEAAPEKVAETSERLAGFFLLEEGNPRRLLERLGFF
ncbi:MAG: hypothetical protein WHS82_02745 [Candidatus Methanosuratincola sp.]